MAEMHPKSVRPKRGAPPNPNPQSCSSCRFLVREGEEGACYRFPPAPLMKLSGDVLSAMPTVKLTWWCGEWKAKA